MYVVFILIKYKNLPINAYIDIGNSNGHAMIDISASYLGCFFLMNLSPLFIMIPRLVSIDPPQYMQYHSIPVILYSPS